jgi:hypothetical protein
VNGDGFDDVVRRRGAGIALHLGSRGGIHATPSQTLTPRGVFVDRVVGAFDVDGDRRDDIAMIGVRPDGERTWVSVHRGTKRGVATRARTRLTAVGGRAIAAAGDLDGDGKADLVLGEIERVVIRRGTAGGVSARAIVVAAPSGDHDGFGFPSGTPGDIDGDGKSDLVIGAPVSGGPIGGTRIGHVFVYRGGALGAPWADLRGLAGAHGGDFGGGIASAAP